ncbi:Pantothenate transporter liz1 [Apiospora arundinis]
MAITHPQGMRPQMPAAARVAATSNPILTTRVLPALAVVGATYAVVSYVRGELGREQNTFDKMFSQQNTPEVMAARKKALDVEVNGDPRNNLLNILGWSK